MSLTTARGPFGADPAAKLNFTPDPETGSVLIWEPVLYRLRAYFAGEPVFDTTNAKLLYETGHLPVYYVPEGDLRHDLLEATATTTSCPHKGEASYRSICVGDRVADDAVWAYREPFEPASFLAGYAALYWKRVDAWFVEDAEVFTHPRDPYHRIDVYPTSRRVRVLIDGEVVADSGRVLALFETALPPRFYFPAEDVHTELLEPSDTRTTCAYKGEAVHRHARIGETRHEDVAWSYPEPLRDGCEVEDRICFYNERVDLEVDGVVHERPKTQWSR